MFLYQKLQRWKYNVKKSYIYLKKILNSRIRIRRNLFIKNRNSRKEILSPSIMFSNLHDIRTFFFASLRASLTVETAIVLPIFLFCMTAVLQYGNVIEHASRFSGALADTGKHMAVAAYATKYGGNLESVEEVVVGALSTAYAQNKVLKTAGDTSAVKNANLLLSSFLEKDEMIDLVLTYQIRTPIVSVKLPGTLFLQRMKVRAWTGRKLSGDGTEEDNGKETSGEYVYVTETGSVYHEDPECTHLKLSIEQVNKEALETMRNNNGAIYHECEKCKGEQGDIVYITKEGTRYHNSLSCSGLKRTVKQVLKEDAGELRACSKCGKQHLEGGKSG